MQQSTQLEALLARHLCLTHVGKVRNAYDLGMGPTGKFRIRGSLATNRRSIFDFRLGFEIPQQGELLTALDLFFRYQLESELPDYSDDLLFSGQRIDMFVPAALKGNVELQKNMILVMEQDAPNIESVVRYILTGGGYKDYAKGTLVCGHKLPPGLRDGSVIPNGPIWTPTTKAEKGHDLPLDFREEDKKYPGVQKASIDLFSAIHRIADRAGYIEVDGKFEGSFVNGLWRWCDERGTTDSSRYILKKDYEDQFVKKGGAIPAAKDKEILRTAGKKLGIDKLDPLKEADREHVLTLRFPNETIEEMQGASHEIFEAFTNHTLTQFQREVMNVRF